MSMKAKAKICSKIAKEERLCFKEERQSLDVNIEFPSWEAVDYDLQMEEFFHSLQDLSNEGLNPKIDLTIEHVSESDIVEVFGGKGIKLYKSTNIMLHLATKMALLLLCWRIYGSAMLSNNKFMACIVKGFVVQQK